MGGGEQEPPHDAWTVCRDVASGKGRHLWPMPGRDADARAQQDPLQKRLGEMEVQVAANFDKQ